MELKVILYELLFKHPELGISLILNFFQKPRTGGYNKIKELPNNGLGKRFWADFIHLSTPTRWELIWSLVSHGSSSLPFMMKVLVWYFASDTHKIMIKLILIILVLVLLVQTPQKSCPHLSMWELHWLWGQCYHYKACYTIGQDSSSCARSVTTFKRFDGITCRIFRNWACDLLYIHMPSFYRIS